MCDDESFLMSDEEMALASHDQDKESRFCQFKQYEVRGASFYQISLTEQIDPTATRKYVFVMTPPTRRQRGKLEYCRVFVEYKNGCSTYVCCNDIHCCVAEIKVHANLWKCGEFVDCQSTFILPGCVRLQITNNPYDSTLALCCRQCWDYTNHMCEINSLEDFDVVMEEYQIHCKKHVIPNWKNIATALVLGAMTHAGSESPVKFIDPFLISYIIRMACE